MALTKEDLAAISNLIQEQIEPLRKETEKTSRLLEDAVQEQIEPLRKETEKTSRLLEDAVQKQIEPLRKEVRKTSLLLENDVLPRLQNIESCYITTYRRYVKGISQIETMQTDIDVLKDVVAEHSELL